MFLLTYALATVVLSMEISVSTPIESRPEISSAIDLTDSQLALNANASRASRIRIIRRASSEKLSEKFVDYGKLKSTRNGVGSADVMTLQEYGDRSLVESMALFFAGFVCLSSIALLLCAVCDTCRDKAKKDKYQNGYVGRIDLADIKVIYNPAADGAFQLPIYAHSSGGPGAGVSVGVRAAGHSNKAFTESQESLVLGNAAVLTSPAPRGQSTKVATNNSVINNTRTTQISPGSVTHVSRIENSTVPRIVKGSNLTRFDAHTDGTATYSLNDQRNAKNNRGTANALSGTASDTKNNRKLKDIEVDRGGNRIVLTYENGAAIRGESNKHRTEAQIRRTNENTDKRTGTGQGGGDGRRKGSRDIEDVANNGGSGLKYDMNDVAIKNMYARY